MLTACNDAPPGTPTACQIQNGHQRDPKWLTGSEKEVQTYVDYWTPQSTIVFYLSIPSMKTSKIRNGLQDVERGQPLDFWALLQLLLNMFLDSSIPSMREVDDVGETGKKGKKDDVNSGHLCRCQSTPRMASDI